MSRHAAPTQPWPADAPWGENELRWIGEATDVTRQLNEAKRAARHPKPASVAPEEGQ